MDVAAPNPNVNDIWSTPSQPVQNPVSDQNKPVLHKPSAGSFSKPGLAGAGEASGWTETPTAEELVERARREEALRAEEVYKAPEALGSDEIGEKLPSPEVLRTPESQKPYRQEKSVEVPPKTASPKEPLANRVVDTRTGNEKTHRVDINKADPVTKTADLKEQDFIEKVEREHIQSVI